MRLFRGECVDVIDGTAYAWTDHGVMAFTEGGAQSVSANAVDFELDTLATRIFESPGTELAAFVRTWSRRGMVLVGAPDLDAGESEGLVSSNVYCYCTTTGGWSKWTFPVSTLSQMRDTGELYAAKGGAWETRRALGIDTIFGMDGQFPILSWILAEDGLSALVSSIGLWQPKIGDWVVYNPSDDPTEFVGVRILEVSGGEGPTLFFDAPVTASDPIAKFGLEAIPCAVQWLGHYTDSSATSQMPHMHLLFDNTGYSSTIPGGATLSIADFQVALGSATDVTPSIITTTVAKQRGARMVDYLITPNRTIARATHFLPYFSTSDICVDWRCVGIALDLEPVGDRTNR